MSHEIVSITLAIVSALAWAYFVFLLITRSSNQSTPLNPFKFQKVRLSSIQDMVFGVIGIGGSMLIITLANNWFDLRLYGTGSINQHSMVLEIAGDILGGVLFGLLAVLGRRSLDQCSKSSQN